MLKKILLTSFQTWLSHQKSNSSDDLLLQLQQNNFNSSYLHFLRKLPVDTIKASKTVINTMRQIKPNIIICCGMAESCCALTLESNAICDNHQIFTNINLEELKSILSFTNISHNAGKFVCESLYYNVLKEISTNNYQQQAIFVHVPILNSNNYQIIMQDFRKILNYFLI